MRLLLTGATGVAGLAIYRAALADPDVSKITVLSRRPIPDWAKLPANAAEKTEVILHTDFLSYPPELARRLAAHDACIWALGKSVFGFTEAEYTVFTHDYPLAALRALQSSGAGAGRPAEGPFRFLYLSGRSADPTATSSIMWARVKGRTETDLVAFCGAAEGMKAHIYRPAYFFPSTAYPEDRKNQRPASARALDYLLGPVAATLFPAFNSPIDELARFSVAVAKGRWPDQELFTNKQMRELITQV